MASAASPISVVDLFAGPGGLSEGFFQFKPPGSGRPFKTAVSAEMEWSAHSTLKLRTFFRLLERSGTRADLSRYFDFVKGAANVPFTSSSESAWDEAGREAMQLTLGEPAHDRILFERIDSALGKREEPWVLIGGPPCQAYSIVGRARNRGESSYVAEDDHRHFLYREYLAVIQRFRPPVFVMENVKGILSSKIHGELVFHSILRDLASPDKAMRRGKAGAGYRLFSLADGTHFEIGCNPQDVDLRKFVIKADEHGVPQRRHRVIILGVREDWADDATRRRMWSPSLPVLDAPTVADAIQDLPRLRSKLSRSIDGGAEWAATIRALRRELTKEAENFKGGGEKARRVAKALRALNVCGIASLPTAVDPADPTQAVAPLSLFSDELVKTLTDSRMHGAVLNHSARSHMPEDLRRYLYASAFASAAAMGVNPRGPADFCLPSLAPLHKNWNAGVFVDRFRVQVASQPTTTITSHIAKDGHYFIHPDPTQCRSLTVREAARIQTFPDNYFFTGNRTQQYIQVGNAVPPLLARQIARVVHSVFF